MLILMLLFDCIDSAAPLVPVEVSITALEPVCVTVSWLVMMIVYTPENYTIQYGQNEASLNSTSSVVLGTTDIYSANVHYSFTICGLESNTEYFYHVVASNSNSSTVSSTKSFITPPPSEYHLSLSLSLSLPLSLPLSLSPSLSLSLPLSPSLSPSLTLYYMISFVPQKLLHVGAHLIFCAFIIRVR